MLTNLNTHTITRSLTGVLLSQLVNNERGFDAVCRERRWSKIALKMGFAPGKAIGSHLRSHYERILYPYNLFQTGANLLVSQMGLLLSLFLSPPLYILHSLFFSFSLTLSPALLCLPVLSLQSHLPPLPLILFVVLSRWVALSWSSAMFTNV